MGFVSIQNTRLIDQNGNPLDISSNTTISENQSGFLTFGIDPDGYIKAISVNSSGEQTFSLNGQHPDGYSPIYLNPVLISGKDNNNTVRTIKTLDNGVIQNKYYELATFNVCATNISTGSEKSLFSIFNDSSKILRIEEIYLINAKTTNVTGISGTFEIRRISGHAGGSLISNIETFESGDILDPLITIRTGAFVFSESSNLLWRNIFSTNEFTSNSQSLSSTQHIFQTMFPIFVKKTNNSKTITLKNGEGLNIKFLQNSNTGSFDIFCVFTQE